MLLALHAVGGINSVCTKHSGWFTCTTLFVLKNKENEME
jgi:hypothetical protein